MLFFGTWSSLRNWVFLMGKISRWMCIYRLNLVTGLNYNFVPIANGTKLRQILHRLSSSIIMQCDFFQKCLGVVARYNYAFFKGNSTILFALIDSSWIIANKKILGQIYKKLFCLQQMLRRSIAFWTFPRSFLYLSHYIVRNFLLHFMEHYWIVVNTANYIL